MERTIIVFERKSRLPRWRNRSARYRLTSSFIYTGSSKHLLVRSLFVGALLTLLFLLSATFGDGVLADPPSSTLQISEIMYNPPDDQGNNGNLYEFLEFYNTGTEPFDLGGAFFSAGVNYTFPSKTSLPPGGYLVLASNEAAFVDKYGFSPFAIYSGQLANNGERITLEQSNSDHLFSVRYNDEAPWPLTADGKGFSLVLRDPEDLSRDLDLGGYWRASSKMGGSPGTSDDGDLLPGVVVNEVLSHSDLPAVDAVELHNPTSQSADVGSWLLTDDRFTPALFQIPPGTIIAPGGYLHFTEDQLGFAFSELGEDAYLFSADSTGELTGYSHGFTFGPAANGVSFGRFVTDGGEEHFPAQKSLTLGFANAGPLVGPVVISEIYYHPASNVDEYVALTNINERPVPLYDPQNPINRWRLNGLGGYEFPPNVILRNGESLLLVRIDPVEFRQIHEIPSDIPIYGPYSGGLDQQQERLQLVRPELPEPDGTIPYIEIDALSYGQAGWPAPIPGEAIQRIDKTGYADTPTNWRAVDAFTDFRPHYQTFLPLITTSP